MSDAEPILSVRNVSKAFGAVQALNRRVVRRPSRRGRRARRRQRRRQVDDHQGDFRRVPRTTTARSCSAESRSTSPRRRRRATSGIETIYQDLALADNLSIGENIFLGREPKRQLLGVLPILDRAKMAEAAKETMAQARLPRDPARRAGRGLFRRPAAGDRHRPRHLLERAARHHGRADRRARRARAAPRPGADQVAAGRRARGSSSSRTTCATFSRSPTRSSCSAAARTPASASRRRRRRTRSSS